MAKPIESLAIKDFVKYALLQKRVAARIRDFSIANEQIEAILLEHFTAMGILTVPPFSCANLLIDKMLEYLSRSPEIRKILDDKAAKEAMLRNQRRTSSID
jgi:hypothetical protein